MFGWITLRNISNFVNEWKQTQLVNGKQQTANVTSYSWHSVHGFWSFYVKVPFKSNDFYSIFPKMLPYSFITLPKWIDIRLRIACLNMNINTIILSTSINARIVHKCRMSLCPMLQTVQLKSHSVRVHWKYVWNENCAKGN